MKRGLKYGPGGPCDCEDACGCYAQGYADGKDKAFFEIEHHLGAYHAAGCGCRPCQVVRAVRATSPPASEQIYQCLDCGEEMPRANANRHVGYTHHVVRPMDGE